MRTFVLSTGRCGSMTVARAFGHATTHTAAHESLKDQLGDDRFDYPEQHIEVDNRLSWFLGSLDQRFPDETHYVHLTRDSDAVARSYCQRFVDGMTRWKRLRRGLWLHRRDRHSVWVLDAFAHALILNHQTWKDPLDVCRFYVETVNANIAAFMSTKPITSQLRLEHAAEDFPKVWEQAGCAGDLTAALAEFVTLHNAGAPDMPF